MSYRAIYVYPWDVADAGAASIVREAQALGLDTITAAGTYHAGKFLRPHGRTSRVYFPEDGTAYFHADKARYGSIVPVRSSLVAEHDVLRDLTGSAMAVNVWMVLLHNSRLGAAHLECTVANAFGDRYVYSLCPSVPEVREYAVALCKDVSDGYDVTGLSLETPGFLPYAHGYHHEFAMVPPNAWLERRLGLCFCGHCVHAAQAAGIDAARLKADVREAIDGVLGGPALKLPEEDDGIWRGDTERNTPLASYLAWRCGVVTSLVREIRAAVRPDVHVAVIPSVGRPTAGGWYEGSDLQALGEAAGCVEACFYEPTVQRIRADMEDVQRRMPGAGRLRGILRPGFPDLQCRDDVVAAAAALRQGGVSEIAFYNYGHLPKANLQWIADAVAAFGD